MGGCGVDYLSTFYNWFNKSVSSLVSIFKGEYEHAMDAKGRVAFPAKLRKYINPAVQDRFIIMKGFDQCLYLFPEDKWQDVEEKLNHINAFSTEGRMVIRHLLRNADDVVLDNQNRISIPPKMIELAGIESKVTFIGAGDRIEIWSPEILNKQTSELSDEHMQGLFEKLLGGGAL